MLKVRETRHGPVISDIAPEKDGQVLAVSMASLHFGETAASGFMALNRAGSVAAAGEAAAKITSPVQNMFVADAEHIGLFVTGRVPIRRAGDGSIPVEGADGMHDWTGFASGGQLPVTVDPPSGRLVNANEPVAPPDFPIFLGHDPRGPWRAERIDEVLAASTRHTAADFARMQTDAGSTYARQLLPVLRGATVPEGTARQALMLLQGCDGTMSLEGPQPLIFNAWLGRFREDVLRRAGVPEKSPRRVAPGFRCVAAVRRRRPGRAIRLVRRPVRYDAGQGVGEHDDRARRSTGAGSDDVAVGRGASGGVRPPRAPLRAAAGTLDRGERTRAR